MLMEEILNPVKEIISAYNVGMLMVGEEGISLSVLPAVSAGCGKKPNHLIVSFDECDNSGIAVKTDKINTVYLFEEGIEVLTKEEKDNIIKDVYNSLHKSALNYGYIFVTDQSGLSLQPFL